jgi:hypothetical protein
VARYAKVKVGRIVERTEAQYSHLVVFSLNTQDALPTNPTLARQHPSAQAKAAQPVGSKRLGTGL